MAFSRKYPKIFPKSFFVANQLLFHLLFDSRQKFQGLFSGHCQPWHMDHYPAHRHTTPKGVPGGSTMSERHKKKGLRHCGRSPLLCSRRCNHKCNRYTITTSHSAQLYATALNGYSLTFPRLLHHEQRS